MATEISEQLEAADCERPTHTFVQTGVGSLAGAVVGYFANPYPDNPPAFMVAETDTTACLYESVAAGGDKSRIVDGDMQVTMAGSVYGEPSTISWDTLKSHVRVFISTSS